MSDGWHADPTGRHQWRHRSDGRWTDAVADGDVQGTDPMSEDADPTGRPAAPTDAGPNGAEDVFRIPPLEHPPRAYDAFISYNHEADDHLAPVLQSALKGLARPWNKRAALDVFRDRTSLSANPDLWGSICAAMDGAEWLVLLSSPEAARSVWVGREIERWIETKGPDRILPVLTSGTWTWDEAAGDFAFDHPEAVTAVHPALRGAFAREPYHIDMTWAKESDVRLSLRNARFRDQIADLAAPLHGKPKEELEGEDVRQQRRTSRLVRSTVSILAVLVIVAVVASLLAVAGQRRAQASERRTATERDLALSGSLAARSLGYAGNRVDQRILLAAEGWQVAPSDDARSALLTAATSARHTRRYVHDVGPSTTAVAVDDEATVIAALDGTGVLRLIDPEAGTVRATSESLTDQVGPPVGLLLGPEAPTIAFLEDGAVIGVLGNLGYVELNVEDLAVVRELELPDGASEVHIDRRGHLVYRLAGLTDDEGFLTDDTIEIVDLSTEETRQVVVPDLTGLHAAYQGRVAAVAGFAESPSEGTISRNVEVVDPVDGVRTVVNQVSHPGTGGATVLTADRWLTVVAGIAGDPGLVVADGVGEVARIEAPNGSSFLTARLVGALLLLGAGDGAVVVHDLDSGVTTSAGGLDGAVSQVASSPDGSLAVAAGDGPSIQLLDLRGTRMGTDLGLPGALQECGMRCLAVEGGTVAAMVDDGVVVGPTTGESWNEVDVEADAVAVSPDGATVAISTVGGELVLTDAEGAIAHRVAVVPASSGGRFRWPPSFSPDGATVAIGYRLVDVASGKPTDDFEGSDIEFPGDLVPDGAVTTAFGGEGLAATWVSGITADGSFQCNDCDRMALRDLTPDLEPASCTGDDVERCGQRSPIAPTTTPASTWVAVPGDTTAATFDPQGRLLVGDARGRVLRYGVSRPDGGAARPDPRPEVLRLAVGELAQLDSAADGRLLVTLADGRVRLHDVETGREIGVLTDAAAGPSAVSVDRAGTTVVFGNEGGGARMLPLDSGRLLADLCRVAGRQLDQGERAALGLSPSIEPACADQPVPTDAADLPAAIEPVPEVIGGAGSDAPPRPEPPVTDGARMTEAVAPYLAGSPRWSGHTHLDCTGLDELRDPDVSVPDGLACSVVIEGSTKILVTAEGHLFLRLVARQDATCEPEVSRPPIGDPVTLACPDVWRVTDEWLSTGDQAPPAWAEDAAASVPDLTLLN